MIISRFRVTIFLLIMINMLFIHCFKFNLFQNDLNDDEQMKICLGDVVIAAGLGTKVNLAR